MPRPIAIVGYSGSGKTALIERLCTAYAARGLRVAVIKHHGHTRSADRPHKDTARVRAAGAEVAVLASSAELAVFRTLHAAPRLADLVAEHARDAEVVLCEGFHTQPGLKLEVYRRAVAPLPLCLGDPDLCALVSDDEVETLVRRIASDDLASVMALLTDLGVAP